ncbi:hypothetical protein [Trichloromonas sp.]|uniref:hypothetical protein n=1 Tax=Trichloromonas sp. TaxID=3069249 RepID=UPI003D8133C2
MEIYREAVSLQSALLPQRNLRQMIRLVRTLYRLSQQPAYRETVLPWLPEVARIDPGHDSVMMGYDFHLTPAGPRLIEVNTNAGGFLLALLAQFGEQVFDPAGLSPRIRTRLIKPFADELRSWSGGTMEKPSVMAIIDENPAEQFLFGEMEYCQRLLANEWGIPVVVADPGQLESGAKGVFSEGRPVELAYNRHCDFYLESDLMVGIREACLAGTVCLSPHPFSYGLLADKRRMVLWSDPAKLEAMGVADADCQRLAELVPESRMLAELDRDILWAERNDWVFKPVARFGSRGVLLGRKITRKRFDGLDPADTLVQRLEPPSLTGGGELPEMKTDFRLYVYKNRVLGVAARLYQGQVTNLRTPGGGFAPVRLV